MKTSILSYIDKHSVFGVETTEAYKEYLDPLYPMAIIGDSVMVFTESSTSQFVITKIENQKVQAKKVWEVKF